MPGGKSGLFPGIEKLHQSEGYTQWKAEEDLLREVGRDRLVEFAQAEQEGRLVVLPCKVGDTVYRVLHTTTGGPHIVDAVVAGLHLGDTKKRRYIRNHEYLVLKKYDSFAAHVDVKQIGKTVFLTREEAEAELKGGAE